MTRAARRAGYLTLTAIAFRQGGHTRHKELARSLLAAGVPVYWIGPSRRDVDDLPGVIYLPLVGGRFLGWPVAGRLLAFLASLWRHRAVAEKAAAVVVLRDLELLAVHLFPPLRDRPTYLVLRNDLVRKSRARAQQASSATARLAARMRHAFFLFLQRRIFPTASRIVVQTPSIARELRRRLGDRVPPLEVLPNDCSPSWTEVAPVDRGAEWRDRPGQLLVGFVGNLLWEVKGLGLLFDAFGEILRRADAKLVIVGGGADLGRAEMRAREPSLAGAVEVVGSVANAFQIMNSFDLLLVTSRYDDCPNVVLEALTAKVPVVATEIEAHTYLLGPDAALVPFGDPERMAERALRVLSDPAELERLMAVQEERRRRFDFDWGTRMTRLLG